MQDLLYIIVHYFYIVLLPLLSRRCEYFLHYCHWMAKTIMTQREKELMSKIKIIWLKHATILRKQCAKEAQEEHTGAFKQSKKCQT